MTTPAGPAPKTPAPPGSLNELQRRVGALARAQGQTVRRLQALVGNVIVCQMLPASAVKGGTGIKLRLGDAMTRETPDLDAAFKGDRTQFVADLNERLKTGWGGFTGSATMGDPRKPEGLPDGYEMQPVAVKLLYRGKHFKTVELEIGYDELNATGTEPAELELSDQVVAVFTTLGLDTPAPVAVLPVHHQISQKLHACSVPGGQRAHDLVDLQLLEPLADDTLVAATTARLFAFRQQHAWPATVVVGHEWDGIYATAAQGLAVLQDVEAAVQWTNDYVQRLTALTATPDTTTQ
ncbi:nucleotidyl transferase AbiEii/AbiGii toxin family protein [Pedococcus bigeumensis]|uniref:nucleotidyl transferase AbiEii/AbiGii toxin family protein n=1 Tax=Pedococcus bigeumensis TaxID=433644 RepID=UPI002FEA6DD4